MKCPVCNKVFDGGECPRCLFPVVESTDQDALLEMLRPQIETHRVEFQKSICFSLLVYYWKEQNDTIEFDREEALPFGNYYDLKGKKVFLPQQFARIPDTNTVDLQVSITITISDQKETKTVAIQNLNEAALQTVGIEVNDRYQFRVLLKNSIGNQSESEWQDVFPDSNEEPAGDSPKKKRSPRLG